MKSLEITPDEARQIIVESQFPGINEILKNSDDELERIFNQLGYVQIDTISVVTRAHHQTLWARSGDYHEKDLHNFQANKRKIYEYWGHAMSYLPMKDFRYSLPRMANFKNPKTPWAKSQIEKSKNIIAEVKKRIADEGPLSAKDFENTSGRKGGPWWDWKPAKIALEVLYWQGELMITERKKFQKVYDLTERVLPGGIEVSFPSAEESAGHIVNTALQSMGIATEKEIGHFLQPGATRDSDVRLVDNHEIKRYLHNRVEEGTIKNIKIAGLTGSYYMFAERAVGTDSVSANPPFIKFLSPFDNLIIQRGRTSRLFGFDYSLECYTPAPKRKFGYFVFPVLFGNKLVARFDPKADRKNKTLLIRNMVPEPEFNPTEKFFTLFAQEMVRFAVFNQCEKIEIEKCPDRNFKKYTKEFSQKVL